MEFIKEAVNNYIRKKQQKAQPLHQQKNNIMLKEIDNKILLLLAHRDSIDVMNDDRLRAMVCTVIEKAYFLESIILLKTKFSESNDNQFFVAKSAVNRYFRDSGLDSVADIYIELCEIAEPYLESDNT